jgi:conserved oligomeric Golgi complex subunit 6
MADTIILSSTNSILSEKVLRALEVRTDTPAMKAALDALSGLPSSDVMDSRSVRVAIEQDALQQALALQQELAALVKLVSELRSGVSQISRIATTVSSTIQSNVVLQNVPTLSDDIQEAEGGGDANHQVKDPNSDSLDKEVHLAALLADAFRSRKEAQLRAETVAAFLEKFNLSEDDERLLESYDFTEFDETDGMAFLEALERVRAIRTDLSSNFGTSGGVDDSQSRFGATSAIRMMEGLATKQERAYERLYHWLQQYLHLNSVSHVPTSSSSSAPTHQIDGDILDEALSHPFVRKSLSVLQHVPAFYSHTIELIASSRRSEETRRFLMALTSGYGGQAPIEMKAHDPINYVGDMLAFCFQSCSVEADVAKGLVVPKEHMDDDDLPSEKIMSAADMLSHAMSGLARPLKSRILQVVASLARRPDEEGDEEEGEMDEEEDSVARSRISSLYSICGLLLFYQSALDKAIQKIGGGEAIDNPLSTAIAECLLGATEAYAASCKVYAAMLESLTLISGDSESHLAKRLMELVSTVRMASPGFAVDVACPQSLQSSLSMEFIAETLLEAALVLCKTLDDAVTLKLTLTIAKKAGLTTTVASALDAKISVREQTLIEDLVKSETTEVLEVCGLQPIVSAWRNMPDVEGITMVSQSGLAVDDLDSCLKDFSASLYSPPLPSFDSIKDPVLRKMARSKIASNIADIYEEFYNAVQSDKGGYDNLAFLGHTPVQVRTLFAA